MRTYYLGASFILSVALCAACEGNSGNPATVSYVRSDSTELKTDFQKSMTSYQVSYQSEEELVESLGIDASTRVVTEDSAYRVKYTTPDGVVEMYFDEGFDEPFHVSKI